MSDKQTKWGLFPGGDPRNFTPETSTSNEKQIAAWRRDCEAFNQADREGKILCSVPSQAVPHEIEMSDCVASYYGGGFFEVSPEKLSDAAFNEIMDNPPEKLPFKAVLG